MKTLLALLAAACFCLVPVMALAGNTAPALYLEIYQYADDPDDPQTGCVTLGTCPEICFHTKPLPVEGIHCFADKTAYNFATIPIHLGRLDTAPGGAGLAQGWPLPCGPGGGYVTISLGVQKTGAAATFMGVIACPNFLAGPMTPAGPPGDILFSATTQCHDWVDHPCYLKYMSTSSTAQVTFDIIGNVDDLNVYKIINCQLGTETSPALTIAGSAQWGGTKSIICGTDPTSVDATTWGKIKALYR